MTALAFIKNENDRNNNMQYLECLSAALNDMALTYQPAERMAVVLRAVMIELRGGPVVNDFKLYKPKSALVPARRGSTNEAADIPMYKKRQTSRPRAGTGSSKKRSMSMASNITNIDLTMKSSGPHRWDAESERSDGFIMITPRSEISSWPPISENTPVLSHSLDTVSVMSTSGPRNTWMGAELDTSEAINNLANVHFPEMSTLNEGGGTTNLDFLNLGDVTDWGREWNTGNDVSVGSDLDGFPPHQPAYGMGFGSLLN